MGTKITIKQNDFSHGMQSDIRDKSLVGQTQAFGAEKIKHFDIYQNGKLKPQPSFERFNTDNEINYGINVVGGKENSTLYGLGKGMDSWYSPQYSKRIKLTPANTSTESDYQFIDLSQLSDDFWDNVESDGSDIRVGTNDMAVTFLYHFNNITKTGFALSSIHEIEETYIYFGSNESTLFTKDYSLLFNSDLFIAAPFDGSINDFSGNNINFSDGTSSFTGGNIGTGTKGFPQNVDNAVSSGDETSFSILLDYTLGQADDGLLGVSPFIFSPDGNIRASIDASGILSVKVDTQSSAFIVVGTEVISNGKNHITVTYNETTGLRTYINGVLDIDDNSDLSGIDTGTEFFKISANYFNSAEFFTFKRNSFKTDNRQIAEGKMLTSETFWTEGSLENFSAHTATFSGIGIYEKNINGTAWKSAMYNGITIKDINLIVFPVPAFINFDDYYTNGYSFLTSQNSDMTGILYGGRAAFAGTLIDADNFDNILSIRQSGNLMNTITLASDKENYITDSGALDVFAPITKSFKYVDLLDVPQTKTYPIGYSAVVYDSFPVLSSATKYGYALALTGTRAGRGSIEVWDLINLDPETVIDLGAGESKVIANVKGNLIAVVDNYLQDDGLSRGKPTLDFRAWLGRDSVKTLQSFEFDNVGTVYANNWEYAIDNRRSDLSNASVFVGEPAVDWKGMWAIGVGEKNSRLAVSILFETESIGRIDTHHSIGNNLILIKDTGEMYKLNDDGDYTQTSTFNTMMIDAGLNGVKKDIVAIELVLDKDLPVGQTVTLKYSTNGSAYATVGTMDVGESITEFTLANGEAFNDFNELQLQIESSGGNASVVEYSVKVEYQEEVV